MYGTNHTVEILLSSPNLGVLWNGREHLLVESDDETVTLQLAPWEERREGEFDVDGEVRTVLTRDEMNQFFRDPDMPFELV